MAGQPCRRHSYCPNCRRPACSAYYCPARTASPGYSMYQALLALHHDIAKDVIHGHTVKADLAADAAAVKVFRKHIVQPITTSGKCSPSISSQSVMCIPSPAKFHFYSFLYFSSSRYLHIHLYITAPISVDLQHFSPMQPLSPTNFSPKKHKKDTEQYCSVSSCINSVLS